MSSEEIDSIEKNFMLQNFTRPFKPSAYKLFNYILYVAKTTGMSGPIVISWRRLLRSLQISSAGTLSAAIQELVERQIIVYTISKKRASFSLVVPNLPSEVLFEIEKLFANSTDDDRSNNRSNNRSINRSDNRSNNRSNNRSINRSINRSDNRSNNRSNNRSINRSENRSTSNNILYNIYTDIDTDINTDVFNKEINVTNVTCDERHENPPYQVQNVEKNGKQTPTEEPVEVEIIDSWRVGLQKWKKEIVDSWESIIGPFDKAWLTDLDKVLEVCYPAQVKSAIVTLARTKGEVMMTEGFPYLAEPLLRGAFGKRSTTKPKKSKTGSPFLDNKIGGLIAFMEEERKRQQEEQKQKVGGG